MVTTGRVGRYKVGLGKVESCLQLGGGVGRYNVGLGEVE